MFWCWRICGEILEIAWDCGGVAQYVSVSTSCTGQPELIIIVIANIVKLDGILAHYLLGMV